MLCGQNVLKILKNAPLSQGARPPDCVYIANMLMRAYNVFTSNLLPLINVSSHTTFDNSWDSMAPGYGGKDQNTSKNCMFLAWQATLHMIIA